MKVHLNPVITRRAGIALLVVGALGMLARHYAPGFRELPHGGVADFCFGLMVGLGFALSFATDWPTPKEKVISIRPTQN